MPVSPGPTVRRRQVGNALRRYRHEAGMSVQQVADALFCSPAKISRLETAQRNATLRDVRDLLNLYNVADEQSREILMGMARESRERGWWQLLNLPPALEVLIGMEQAATRIKEFEIVTIPGLLQTREYAAEFLGELIPDERERQQSAVDTRMKRQRILKESSSARLTMILDEAALHRLVGGADVMKGQLEHLVELIDADAAEVLVVPFSAGAHRGMLNGFTVLEFEELPVADVEPGVPPIAYVEYQDTTVYFDQPSDVTDFAATFESLRARSLTQGQSRALLRSISEAL
jgi:transcriptional regulator with XRE-family HTH domain